jgi:hypothetical protein
MKSELKETIDLIVKCSDLKKVENKIDGCEQKAFR